MACLLEWKDQDALSTTQRQDGLDLAVQEGGTTRMRLIYVVSCSSSLARRLAARARKWAWVFTALLLKVWATFRSNTSGRKRTRRQTNSPTHPCCCPSLQYPTFEIEACKAANGSNAGSLLDAKSCKAESRREGASTAVVRGVRRVTGQQGHARLEHAGR